MVEATRKRRSTFVCHFCNAIVATTFGTKDAFEKHMEETHNILTNLNVVMAIHTMTEEEKENLMRTKRMELEQAFGLKVEIGENETVEEEPEENPPSFIFAHFYALFCAHFCTFFTTSQVLKTLQVHTTLQTNIP